MKIRCHTLFDTTRTNINSRRQHLETDGDPAVYSRQRSQQSNLETILQIVGMRSQPEDITEPTVQQVKLDDAWGYIYAKSKQKTAKAWSFEFTVSHASVFNNGIDTLGNLIQDCAGVPMLTQLDETLKLPQQLEISDELRNIYFEVIDNE